MTPEERRIVEAVSAKLEGKRFVVKQIPRHGRHWCVLDMRYGGEIFTSHEDEQTAYAAAAEFNAIDRRGR